MVVDGEITEADVWGIGVRVPGVEDDDVVNFVEEGRDEVEFFQHVCTSFILQEVTRNKNFCQENT